MIKMNSCGDMVKMVIFKSSDNLSGKREFRDMMIYIFQIYFIQVNFVLFVSVIMSTVTDYNVRF